MYDQKGLKYLFPKLHILDQTKHLVLNFYNSLFGSDSRIQNLYSEEKVPKQRLNPRLQEKELYWIASRDDFTE